MAHVLFVCLHNAGRSQMSQSLFEQAANGHHEARSAGTSPAGRVHPNVVAVMREEGVDLSDRVPRLLTDELARWADVVVTMGCGDACPVIPGRRYIDWELIDPKDLPIADVRRIRDDIKIRVASLVEELERTRVDLNFTVNQQAEARDPVAQTFQLTKEQWLATKILELVEVSVIRAAGGVVCRTGRFGETEIAVIHRPAYDDWTLPKGKIEPDEKPEDCALREVREETGLRCELGRPLGCTAYVDRRGRDKVVCYWMMEVKGGRFRPGIEVDKLLWLSVDDAIERLTYGRDKTLLMQQDLD